MPRRDRFGPLGESISEDDFVIMTIDEYETIRLIDLEGFTQEQCANQMHIARTTVQGMYNDAREKLAQSLVHGKVLKIEGGDYELCDGLETYCACGGCHRHRCGRELEKEDKNIDEECNT